MENGSRILRFRYNIPWVCFMLLLMVICCHARATITNPLTLRVGGTDGAASGPLHLFLRTIQEARRHLAAAAVARSVSIFAMYPVDTIKTRIQMDQANPLRLEGLYRGVSGSLLGQVPYG
jgi:Mitochondrial carrier protein